MCGDAAASVDMIEIDGASNRGIEDIRTLRENVKYSPARGRYKVYIIDEVHQLTERPSTRCSRRWKSRRPTSSSCSPRPTPRTAGHGALAGAALRLPTDRSRSAGGDARGILQKEKLVFEAAALPAIVRGGRGLAAGRALAARYRDRLRQWAAGRRDHGRAAGHHGAGRGARLRRRAGRHEPTPAAGGHRPRRARGRGSAAPSRATSSSCSGALSCSRRRRPRSSRTCRTPRPTSLRALGEAASLDDLLYVLRAFLDADEVMRESPHPRVELEIAAVRATRRPQPRGARRGPQASRGG